nr:RNA-directed DNA polymerase, eukaryota, reverse transcriptase zinc-binding domain protein [Tanacetum cinerariifolium]
MDRLPTRYNLDARGIDLDSTGRPVCDGCVETSQHLFIDCTVARGLWKMISRWWKLGDYPEGSQHGVIQWISITWQKRVWMLFFKQPFGSFGNCVCFDSKLPRKDTFGEDVMIHSHLWIKHRNKNMNPIWLDWIADSIAACTNRL